jgi:hypothetical protein
MATYERGACGDEVRLVQNRLQQLQLYTGPVDGIFDGAVESAVIEFQKQHDLSADGAIGARAWSLLFPGQSIPEPALYKTSLGYRCMALSALFETGLPTPDCFAAVSGNFSGHGIGFGALQWSFADNSLQALLREMDQNYRAVLAAIFHKEYDVLLGVLHSSHDEQMAWACAIQHPVRHTLGEPWLGLFKALGRSREFQGIEIKYALKYYRLALSWCREFDFWSQRAVALMFDIRVQNGVIFDYVKVQILHDLSRLGVKLGRDEREHESLRIVANRLADACPPGWREDVLQRKVAIADGRGLVRGSHIDLDQMAAIGLMPWK